jgi:hypothetical protein
MNKAGILEGNCEPTGENAKRQERDAPRLRLEKETIRTLSEAELGAVGGGALVSQ